MATGANAIPLGKIHPILAGRLNEPPPQQESASSKAMSRSEELKQHLEAAKRAASALFPKISTPGGSAENSENNQDGPVPKKRRSRWASEEVRAAIPGLPTELPMNMSEQQQQLYIMHLRVEEISRMLRTGDLGIPVNPGDRSPSPEPIYSHDGKRLNTREVRVKKKLEDERHDLIQKAMKSNSSYKPPADYKPSTKKFEDKVFIPQDDHPETNFVGLLIGPRGNTLKQLEKDTNTKIMIRGKGATKEGKLGRSGLPQPGEDEPLHALITGQSPEVVKDAVDKIKKIIQSGIDNPGNDNELKQLQLQQLAELNGTFKPIDVLRCRNCGSPGHRSWECTEQKNVVSNIICTRCGGGGHIASDCKTDVAGATPVMSAAERAKMDSEYMSLMKELGETVPGMTSNNSSNNYKSSSSGHHGNGQQPQQPLLGGGAQTYEGMGGEDQAAAAAAFGAYAPWFAPHPGFFGHPGILLPHPGAPSPWMGHPMMPMAMAPGGGGGTGEEATEDQQSGGIPPWQVMNPWQQGMMYPMGMMPGVPNPGGMAPPPPPPDQNWNAGAPQPPPPETST